MLCCGGQEEEPLGPPAHQYAAPPTGGMPGTGPGAELLAGRKPVDHTMPKGQQSLVTRATPRLSENKEKQCVDPKLNNNYPPKAITKLAAVAALYIQYEADFRPNMTIVVKALKQLLNSKAAGPDSNV